MGSAAESCWYCVAGVPVETVAARPACERCAKDLRDTEGAACSCGARWSLADLAEDPAAADEHDCPLQTPAHEEAA